MDYNPFLPEVQQNPYPYYAYLRQHAPVYHVPGLGFWAVSCYEVRMSSPYSRTRRRSRRRASWIRFSAT